MNNINFFFSALPKKIVNIFLTSREGWAIMWINISWSCSPWLLKSEFYVKYFHEYPNMKIWQIKPVKALEWNSFAGDQVTRGEKSRSINIWLCTELYTVQYCTVFNIVQKHLLVSLCLARLGKGGSNWW